MRSSVFKAGVLFTVSLNSLSAFAFDRCADILRNGVRDEINSSNSYEHKVARHFQFCSIAKKNELSNENFNSFAREYASKVKTHQFDAQAGGGFSWGPFSLSGNYGQNRARGLFSEEDKINILNEHRIRVIDYYNQNCGNESYENHLKKESALLSKIANRDIINGWRDCMLNHVGFFVQATPAGDLRQNTPHMDYNLTVLWRSKENTALEHLRFKYPKDKVSTDVEIEMLGQIFDETANQCSHGRCMLNNGEREFNFRHTNLNDPAIIAVNARSNTNTDYAQRIIFPAKPEIVEDQIPLEPNPVQPRDAIVEFKVVSQVEASVPLKSQGWEWNTKDLNSSHRGKYIFVGYRKSMNQDPVTSVGFVTSDRPLNAESLDHSMRTKGFTGWSSQDLNESIGGKYIYLGWKVNEPGKLPIQDIRFFETDQCRQPELFDGWIPMDGEQDLCEGAKGTYIWGYYKN